MATTEVPRLEDLNDDQTAPAAWVAHWWHISVKTLRNRVSARSSPKMRGDGSGKRRVAPFPVEPMPKEDSRMGRLEWLVGNLKRYLRQQARRGHELPGDFKLMTWMQEAIEIDGLTHKDKP